VRWGSKVETVAPRVDGGCDVLAGGTAERFDVVVGATNSPVSAIITVWTL
jgi:hypothetical protein